VTEAGHGRGEGASAQLFAYPTTDARFAAHAVTSLSPLLGRPITDPAVLAAAEASLRSSYPLAALQPRPARASPRRRGAAWDVFRDGEALDDELLRRARGGDRSAVGQLYDRHQGLAYSVAAAMAGRPPEAQDAVVTAFRVVIADHGAEGDVRVRLARTAREAALRRAPTAAEAAMRATGPPDLPRMVLELALAHQLVARQIAAVLDVEVTEVRRLAVDAIRTA
jgi:DNA-directed RNA polymerase specialized sigma24 family protein